MRLPRFIKKPLTGLALLAAGASASAGIDASIDVGINETANGTSNPSGMGSYGVLVTINNTYDSIVFDKVSVSNLFANYLADSIVSANPNADKDEIMADYKCTMVIPTGSDVDKGWRATMDEDGSVNVTNNGIIPGITYEKFGPGKSISLYFQGDLEDLDVNGDGVYDPESDLSLDISNDLISKGLYADLPTGTAYAEGDIKKIKTKSLAAPIYMKGDINKDGAVNIKDLIILSEDWLLENDRSDLTGDNYTDLRDFSVISKNWMYQTD